MKKKHLLITGSHRSGTTWVGKTISQHQAVSYVHEPFNVNYPNRAMGMRVASWYTHYPSSAKQERGQICKAFDMLFKGDPLRRSLWINKNLGLKVSDPLRWLKSFAWNFQQRSYLVKDPIALMSADWLYERYDLAVVCMIRNPYGFVGSLKKAGWDFDFSVLKKQQQLMEQKLSQFSAEIDEIGGQDKDFIDRACLFWNILHAVIYEYQKTYPSWLFVQHESIAADPLLGFGRIFDFLELDMDSRISEYIAEFTSSSNYSGAISAKYQPRNARECVDSWKRRLTRKEIERVGIATERIFAHFY